MSLVSSGDIWMAS